MASKATIDATPDQAFALESKRIGIQAGWLGHLFGTGATAVVNITGTTILLLVVAGVVFTLIETKMGAPDYWKTIGPIITLALGYLFGRKS